MIVRGTFAVLKLGLGDGRTKVDVPERRRHRRVDLAARDHREETSLGDLLGVLGDGGVLEAPVDAQTEMAPQILEDLFV